MDDQVIISRTGGVVSLRINRPKERNMLSDETIDQLDKHVQMMEKDNSVRVVIITGQGHDFFCGGVFNPVQKMNLSADQIRSRRQRANDLFDRLESSIHPIIAAINGRVQAGGLEMALACDIRVAASHATFALPESSWGGFPGCGGPIRLSRIVGMGKAMEIIMTGRDVQAKEALSIRLVEHVFPSRAFQSKVNRLAEAMASSGPLGNRAVKQLVRSSSELNMRSARPFSDSLREFVACSMDGAEGIAAYREGRLPRFQGS